MMRFIQFGKDEMLNVDCIESLYRHYLGGTVVIGKSGKEYITNYSLEEVVNMIGKLVNME